MSNTDQRKLTKEYEGLLRKYGSTFKASSYFSKRSFEIEKRAIEWWFKDAKNCLIADIGSGPGILTEDYTCKNDILAVDLSYDIVKAAAKKKHIPVVGDAYILPISDHVCDMTFVNGLLPNIHNLKKLIQEAVRITKPNGKIYISNTNLESIFRKMYLYLKFIIKKSGLFLKNKNMPMIKHNIKDIIFEMHSAGVKEIEIIYIYYPLKLYHISKTHSLFSRLISSGYGIAGRV